MQPKIFLDAKKYKRRVIGKAIACGVIAAVLILLALLKLSAEVCEWYSLNIASAFIKAAITLTSPLPFSLFEILIYAAAALIISFLIFIIVALCRKQFKRALNGFVDLALIVFIVGTIYGACVILPYNRAPVDIPLYQGSTELDKEEVYEMAHEYVLTLNELSQSVEREENGELIVDGGIDGLNERLNKAYKDVLTSDYFYDVTPKLKKWLWPELMSAFSISGVFFAPTGESNVCTAYYSRSVVATAAHEMAHAKGVMREADANLVSYYVLLNCDDDLLRYAGYSTLVGEMLEFLVYYDMDEEQDALYDMLSDEYYTDNRFTAEYAKKQGSLQKIGNFFNDIYLKLSGLEDGTDNYSPDDDISYDSIPGENGTIIITQWHINEFSDVKKMLLETFYQK